MAIYAIGDEADSFQIHAGTFSTTGQTDTKDSSARYGMICTSTKQIRLDLNTAVSEAWFHTHTYSSGASSDTNFVMYLAYNRTNSRPSVRWLTPSTGGNVNTHKIQYTSNGTTWTDLVTFTMVSSPNQIIDIYFKGGSSGAIRVYQGGQLQASATGSYTLQDTTWDALVLSSASTGTHYWGSIIVASENTINWSLNTIQPTAAGNSTAWTGAYTDVDDTYYDEADFITTNTTGVKFLANLADITLPSGRIIKGVAASARGLISSGAVASIAFLARHSSTDYTYNNLGLTVGGGVASSQQIFELDPLGAAWTQTTVNALQLGVISA